MWRRVAPLLSSPLRWVAPAPQSTSPTTVFSRAMSVLKSGSVKRWLAERAIENPTKFVPWKWNGKWRGPELGRRKQALMAKEAIRAGEIKLEPTLMVPPTKFKGHKRQHNAVLRRELVAQKMMEMPKLIAEFRAARREKRMKIKESNRWK